MLGTMRGAQSILWFGAYTGYQFILRDKSIQIDGAEFEFLGLEKRFERNKRLRFWRLIFDFGINLNDF